MAKVGRPPSDDAYLSLAALCNRRIGGVGSALSAGAPEGPNVAALPRERALRSRIPGAKDAYRLAPGRPTGC